MSSLIKELTEENFNEVTERDGQLALVDFWAPWCGPCLQLAPVIDELAEAYGDQVLFLKVNIDEQKSLSDRFSFKSIPTLILLKGGKEIARLEGRSKTRLAAEIERYL